MADAGAVIVALAIPFFFVLIVIELVAARLLKRRVYRYGDATADLSCGVGYVLADLFLKFVVLGVYGLVWNARLIDWPEGPWAGFTAAHWALGILGVDFFYYWWHRTSHVVNAMWAVHAVHHQSEDYNLAVALRQALLTSVSSMWFYLPLALLGVHPLVFAVAGAVSSLGQYWIHTELLPKLGPLEWVVNTPSQHRVHHAVNVQYLDKNYGAILCVWDRIFGTFEEEVEAPTYGTTKPIRSYSPLWANLEHWVRMYRMYTYCEGWERAYVWVAHPAWKPAKWPYLEGPVDLKRAKYDPPSSPAVRRYVAVQQLLIFPAVVGLVLAQPMISTGTLFLAVVAVIAATASWNGLLEGREWVSAFERLRTPTTGTAVFWTVWQLGPLWLAILAALAFTVPFTIWFQRMEQQNELLP